MERRGVEDQWLSLFDKCESRAQAHIMSVGGGTGALFTVTTNNRAKIHGKEAAASHSVLSVLSAVLLLLYCMLLLYAQTKGRPRRA